MVFEHCDVRVVLHRFHQSALYFKARVVRVVQDAELRVSAFSVQVVVSIGLLVEVDAPFHEASYAVGCIFHHLPYRLRVGDIVAGHQRVLDMFVKVVDIQVGNCGDTPLGLGRVGFLKRCFTH